MLWLNAIVIKVEKVSTVIKRRSYITIKNPGSTKLWFQYEKQTRFWFKNLWKLGSNMIYISCLDKSNPPERSMDHTCNKFENKIFSK